MAELNLTKLGIISTDTLPVGDLVTALISLDYWPSNGESSLRELIDSCFNKNLDESFNLCSYDIASLLTFSGVSYLIGELSFF